MGLYSDPPPLRDFYYDKPTLLVCWWATIFCAAIILLRIAGRFIRSERLFAEDRTAALALIPLFIRMGFVHAILVYGTNNVDTTNLPQDQVRRRSIGSGLVLASRIFHAATLWTLKNAILEFFKRLTSATWDRSSRQILLAIRVILVATFIAVVISDLAECQPFSHYWQVIPDPGGRCRQGFAQLLTMAVCNILTDLLLVCFPIPIIIKSQMGLQKKIQLILLFSMSLPVVACTLYRVPNVIFARGSQQTRSLIASVEIMFATAAANALVLGSFVRDRGVKKKRFKYGSVAESMERSEGSRSRRPTAIRHWGSDEDLVRDLGLGVEPGLRDIPEDPAAEASHAYTPAGPAPTNRMTEEMRMWRFDQNKYNTPQSDDSVATHDNRLSPSQTNTSITPRRVSFFDVSGLLSPGEGGDSARRPSHHSGVDPLAPNPSLPASPTGLRRGSTAILQDIGGLLGPSTPRSSDPVSRARGDAHQRPHPQQSIPHPRHAPGGGAEAVLADVGGLLGPPRGSS